MNWAALSPAELTNYAPLHATTDLERALVERMERLAEGLKDAEGRAEDAEGDAGRAYELEAKFDNLVTALFGVLNDEEGDEAHLLKRTREVLEAT